MLTRPRHDRWLLSYADFVTLLFAMFVVLYAFGRTHPKQSFPQRSQAAPATAGFHSNLLAALQANFQLEQANRQVTISTDPRGIVLALDERICFRPGESAVQPAATAIFEKIGHSLAGYHNRILLVGHTDSQPIHNDRFRSNWELSSARSIEVMRLMQASGQMEESRFTIEGSADKAPLSKEVNEDGRAQNRRVDVVVLDDSQIKGVL